MDWLHGFQEAEGVKLQQDFERPMQVGKTALGFLQLFSWRVLGLSAPFEVQICSRRETKGKEEIKGQVHAASILVIPSHKFCAIRTRVLF